jgi:ribosomal-protein-alanine N-acetyltransferase
MRSDTGSALHAPSPDGVLPPLTLRAATVRDVDAIAGIEVRAYGFPWSRGNFVDSLAAGYLVELLETPDPAGGPALPLGYFVAMPGVDELHLLNVTVAPEWQGRGLGHRLLQAVLARGRALGLTWLWLRSNGRAQALYRRLGFDEVGVRRGYYPAAGRREDAIVMRRALDETPETPRDAVD